MRAVAQALLWQVGSLLLTSTGYCSSKLAARGIDAPTAQSAANYMLLSLHSVQLWLRQRRQKQSDSILLTQVDDSGSNVRWWVWLLIAAADVEANYLLVRAYQYTDITSVCVLDAFTVPTVMILSRCYFGVGYTWRQLCAAMLCVVGIVVLFATDLFQNDGVRFPRAWVGDLLVLLGATLYGCSNVAQEHMVRVVVDRVEYLANLGTYGAIIAIAQSLIVERSALEAVWATAKSSRTAQLMELAALEAGYVGSLFGFYMLVAALLESGSSATLMNLSLLTSDFSSVAIGVTLLHSSPGAVYAVAFALVVGGLTLYHTSTISAREPDSSRQVGEEECVSRYVAHGGGHHGDPAASGSAT